MSKTKTVFFCQNCGAQSPKWVGRCPSCGEWNTIVEEIISTNKTSGGNIYKKNQEKPIEITSLETVTEMRIDTHSNELNRVLGGGIVKGALVLVGGEPGVGKSTLMLQIALRMKNKSVLYVSGEESAQQIKMRANRIGSIKSNCYIYTDNYLENIITETLNLKPDLIIIDSIQTIITEKIDSAPGSISQIRECAAELLKFAKISGIPIFIIGHITKDGFIAGPKVLEHIVDTVLYLEGDKNYIYRILRANKNRFGSTSEIGIFEMNNEGLREVLNPSEILITHRDDILSGTTIASTVEGIRPLMVEVQALVTNTVYGTPQRSNTGFDQRRLNMLLAVLEKKAGLHLGNKDVFLNITGGIKVEDTSIDLAIAASIISSYNDKPVDNTICFAGEIGLTGEVRPVTKIEQRIYEAEKLGYKKICISKYNKKIDNNYRIQIIKIKGIYELFPLISSISKE